MLGLFGPFSEGHAVLRVAVLFGVALAAVAVTFADTLGVALDGATTALLVAGGVLVGLGLVFLAHVRWHRRGPADSDWE